jgi:hypothetical protein
MLFGNEVVPGPNLDYDKKEFANLQYLKTLVERFNNKQESSR